jgi:ATP-dependent DNA helicase DinG
MQERCESLAGVLSTWIGQQAPGERILDRGRARAEAPRHPGERPLDVGPTLRATLFDRVPTCVLTSATLSVGTPPRFDFLKTRMGPDLVPDLAARQPVRLREPGDHPPPAQPARPLRRARRVRADGHPGDPRYLERTHGKAFVLFTSTKMLANAARELTPWFARRNIALFAQGDGMPRSKMVEAFKADVDSVLFGVDSFWQGIDVPGEALSNVVIVRLPFSVPSHPLLEPASRRSAGAGGTRSSSTRSPRRSSSSSRGSGA